MHKGLLRSLLVSAVIFLAANSAVAQTTAFKYQGRLNDNGVAANGAYQLQFRLYDSPSGGSQIGSAISDVNVTVADGIFAAELDFGSAVFGGASRYLEISVRRNSGESYTTLFPREQITSSPFSVRTLSAVQADFATNAGNANTANTANTAMNFTGPLGGDVTGSQNATTVARLQGRNVSNAAPTNGQVLKFDAATSQWRPDTDIAGSGGGGGTITGVTAGTGLTGGGSTGSVTVGIANGGVGNAQLADGAVSAAKIVDGAVSNSKLADASVTTAKIVDSNVTDPKIASLSGAKVTGAVASATNATTAVNFTGPLAGDVAGTQATTSISNSAVTTAKLADNAVTSQKIATGQVVKSVNSLKDDVTLAAGTNITITPAGNTLTIAASGSASGVTGSGTVNTIPVWSGGTSLGNSLITQTATDVNLPNAVNLAVGGHGNNIRMATPNGETGITIAGPVGRADLRFDGQTLKLVAGAAGGPPSSNFGISMGLGGAIGIGTSPSGFGRVVVDAGVNGNGIYATSNNDTIFAVSTNAGSSWAALTGVNNTSTGLAGRFLGRVRVDSIPLAPSSGSVCFDSLAVLVQCGASSLQLKKSITPFRHGLDVITRLKPINYEWKDSGIADFGLGAEDVAGIDPQLAIYGKDGRVEGVKYDRINLVLINAIKQQQAQIAALKATNRAMARRLRAIERRLSGSATNRR